VKWLSDDTLEHLRAVADWPDMSQTRYEVVEPIARGGMGTVYLARDRDLEREVALKVLSIPEPGPGAAGRMLREARIIARLEHPGIVPVHDVGALPDGRIYYAMKRVSGRRLDELVAEPLPERLRVFERICEPVAFAHAHGVVHRDLKPENVMVGPFGEVLVMDWGVAKLVRDRPTDAPPPETRTPGSTAGPEIDPPARPDETAHGTILGTPGYMSPEQARGEVERIDARSDIFGLGAILYFLLSGETPGRPASVDTSASTLTRDGGGHAASAIETWRRRDPSVPRALEAVCRKAMAADPSERYSGAQELAAEIRRYLSGQPVSAFPEGLVQRTRRFVGTYRTPILLILAYLLMRALLLLFAGT
jgi:eukaryotic-like serine/threonine-protein kinase